MKESSLTLTIYKMSKAARRRPVAKPWLFRKLRMGRIWPRFISYPLEISSSLSWEMDLDRVEGNMQDRV
jgi:hypothetical protein